MQTQPGNATMTQDDSSEARLATDPAIGRSGPPAQSTLGLIRQLIDELAALFRHEVALARAELTESARAAATGRIRLAVGTLVLFVALLTAVAAGVLLLALIVPAWLAALAIGLVLGALGYGILSGARRKLDVDSLKPTHTPASLRKDAAVLPRKHTL